MKNTNLRETAELLGIVAIVGSLIFVGLQMRQAGRIAFAESDASYLSATIDILGLLNDHPETWVRGNTEAALDEAEAAVFENLVIAVNDRVFLGYQQLLNLGNDEGAERDLHDFAIFLFQNPGARRVWVAREANLAKYRNVLDPNGLDLSFYSKAIELDLAKLDQLQE
jgi:hypothetical protein